MTTIILFFELDWRNVSDRCRLVPFSGGPVFGGHANPFSISPDGRWLAFASNRTGTEQVYIKRFPEKGGLYQISDGGGLFPIWTPNGKALLYLAADRTSVRGVTVELTDPPRISRPGLVMSLPTDVQAQDWRPFGTLDREGRRLLLVRNASPTADLLAVIENWWPQLKELAPAGR